MQFIYAIILFLPPAMVDGNGDTWWQSMSRNRLNMLGYGITDTTPDAVITIDLEQVGNTIIKKKKTSYISIYMWEL